MITRAPFVYKTFIILNLIWLTASCDNNDDSSSTKNKLILDSSATKSEKVHVTLRGTDFSYDGKQILVSRAVKGAANLYQYSIDGKLSMPLTDYQSKTTYVESWFPSDNRILFSLVTSANHSTQLFVLDTNGAKLKLTEEHHVDHRFLGWKATGESFFVLLLEANSETWQLWEYYSENLQKKLIFKNELAWKVADVSDDGQWLALVKYEKNDQYLYLLDLTQPDTSPKFISEVAADYSNKISFSPNTSQLIYPRKKNNIQAWAYYLGEEESNRIVRSNDQYEFIQYSRNGNYRVLSFTKETSAYLLIHDMDSGESITLPSLPTGHMRDISFSANGSHMTFIIETESSSDLYVYSFHSNQITRLTKVVDTH